MGYRNPDSPPPLLFPPGLFSWYSQTALLQLRLSYLNLHSDGERDRAEERESEIDNTGHSPMTTLKGIWGEERKGGETRGARADAKTLDGFLD